MPLLLGCLLPALIVTSARTQPVPEPTLKEVLTNWEAASAMNGRDYAFDAETRTWGDNGPDKPRRYEFSIEDLSVIARSDGSYDWTITRYPSKASFDALPDHRWSVQRLMLVLDRKPPEFLEHVYYSQVSYPARVTALPADKALAPNSYLAHLFSLNILATEHDATFLLKTGQARLRPDREVVDGLSCFVIEAATEFGDFTFWIAPDRGWNVVKSVDRRGIGDQTWVGEETRPLPRAGWGRWSGWTKTAINTTSNAVSFMQVDGAWYVEKIRYTLQDRYEDGGEAWSGGEERRWNLTFHPKFEKRGAFIPRIRNGTQVFLPNRGAESRHQWMDGEIVSTDAKVEVHNDRDTRAGASRPSR